MVPLDAILGVSGLPQNATGQTSLLTGVNAQALLVKHLNGFPNAKLREIIGRHGFSAVHLPSARRPSRTRTRPDSSLPEKDFPKRNGLGIPSPR